MPKSNLPPHAGPYQPAYNPSASTSGSANGDSSAELSNTGTTQPGSAQSYTAKLNPPQELDNLVVKFALHPARMVWVALAFLGFGLVFAIYAIIHHG